MKAKNISRFIVYFVYVVIFMLLVKYGYEYCFYRLQYPGSKYLDYIFLGKPIVFAFLVVYFAFTGLMFALPRFISSVKEQGIWKFDWVVFLAVCIPALYVTVTPWIPETLWSFWPLRDYFGSWGHLLQNITATIFTFFLLTSFHKSNSN